MANTGKLIQIQSAAPTKPTVGQPCNGCGVCCLHEPCPLGILLSGRRHGACVALRWDEKVNLYRCGALSDPEVTLGQALPKPLTWLWPSLSWLAPRWIAAGKGCDCSLEVLSSPTIPPDTQLNQDKPN